MMDFIERLFPWAGETIPDWFTQAHAEDQMTIVRLSERVAELEKSVRNLLATRPHALQRETENEQSTEMDLRRMRPIGRD